MQPPLQAQGAMATVAAILTVPCSGGRRSKRSSQPRGCGSGALSVRASSDANSKRCEPRLLPFPFWGSSHGLTTAFRLKLPPRSGDAAGLRRGERAQRAQRHPPPRLRHPRRAEPGGHPRRGTARLSRCRRLRLRHGRPQQHGHGRRTP